MRTPVELVSLLVCDLAGIARGRSFPRGDLDRRLETGVGWVPANQSLTPFGDIPDTDPHGSTGDLRLIPDPDTAVRLEWPDGHPPLGFFLCDIRALHGGPYEGCPRTLLRAACGRLRSELGLEAQVSFEHEFELISDDPAEPPFSLRAQRAVAPFGEAVVDALERAGAEPETFLPEYGRHQFEITCRPAMPLMAADRAVVVREVVREIGRTQGRPVTFTPLSSSSAVGNGVHVHVSLRPVDGEAAAAGAGELGAVESAFAAGLLRHARALCALTAPSAISYGRLQPHRWSAAVVALGHRNRETLLRVCGPAGAPGHLEYRAADAAACPHLALAALLEAGMEGVRAGLPAPPQLDEDPSRLSLEALDGAVAARVPGDLGEALDALERDEVLSGALPPLLLDTYVAAKRSELATAEALAVDERHARYRQVY